MKHLKDTGMNYFQHMLHALRIACLLIGAGCCCAIHSIFPFLFESTTSKIIKHLNDNMISRQIRKD